MLKVVPALLCANVVAGAAILHGERPGCHYTNGTERPYALPSILSSNGSARAQAIQTKRAGWLYGPSIAGNTSYYPTGELADPVTTEQTKALYAFQDKHTANSTIDAKNVMAAVNASGGINSLDQYRKLYDNQWKLTAPAGPFPGMLSNYTSDLLFSMERLSTSPAAVARVGSDDALLFEVDNAESITGTTMEELQAQGRLFVVDYSDQKDLPRSSDDKFGAACQAYFYIDPTSADFLPLAIKPNVNGSALVYTPEDKANDWTLAKMMFSLNDFWFTQWYHLAANHETAEIVYMAAIRTLSDDHPILAMLNRVMKEAWSLRPEARDNLINPGGPVDRLFPWAGSTAGDYTDNLYHSGLASNFQANYLETNLRSRGLLNSTFGPALKHFPYYEDASVVMGEIRIFMRAFIGSYYHSAADVLADKELQAWVKEAGPAEIKDFPSTVATVEDIVDIMSHQCFLSTVQHGVLNTNSPVASTASLPLHPLAFYAPLPTEKGVTDVMSYMPPLDAAISQIMLLASFNRPEFVNTNQTLSYLFEDLNILSRMNRDTRKAAATFHSRMDEFSKVVRSRTFDSAGLSQGMPFIWSALDPNTASFWLTI